MTDKGAWLELDEVVEMLSRRYIGDIDVEVQCEGMNRMDNIKIATSTFCVLHGESKRGQATPRTTIQHTCQPQEAVQT